MSSFYRNRLEELRELEDGWLGPRSVAPSSEVIDRAHALTLAVEAEPSNIWPCPTGDGDIVLEWDSDDIVRSVYIQYDGNMYFVKDDILTDTLAETPEIPYDHATVVRFIETGELPV